MKSKNILTAVFLGLWAIIWMSVPVKSLPAQSDADEQLNAFLPDDEEKVLVIMYCTACHSAAATQERIASRAGGDKTFWTTLVRRMVTVWNAQIPDEDVDSITTYLAKHFGPSSAPGARLAEKKPEAKKKPDTGKNPKAEKKKP